MSKYTPNETYYFENHTSAQTANTLVAAPGTNRRICVSGILFSCEDAGNVRLVEDPAGTPVDKSQKVYAGATGGVSAVMFAAPIRLTANTALGFTSVTTTNHSVGVFYYVE